MPPPVTVLLCTYNAAPFLGAAVRSILQQTFRDFEFLIIDDASSDDTPQLLASIRDPRIRVLRNVRNFGLTASLNRGLREARGEWIARQDADDLSTPDRLEKQLAFVRANSEVALAGAQMWAIDSAGRRTGSRDVPLSAESVHWAMLFANPVVHTAAMFRRDVFLDQLGAYDERFTSCQDYELWARASEKHRLCNLPERLVHYRMHPTSISTSRVEANQRLVRESLVQLLETRGLREQFTEGEVTLLARFRWSTAPADAPAMRTIIERLQPRLAPAADARRTLAWVYAHLGYSLLPRSGVAGLRELFRAALIAPRYAATFPWPKILALATVGESARRAIAALRARSTT